MSNQSTTRLPVDQNQVFFKELAQQAIAHAKHLGASDAVVEVAESCGLSVAVRNQSIDTVEQNRDRGLNVSVYKGNSRGSASTSDFSAKAIKETVEAAWNIAGYTAEDYAAALPDPNTLAAEFPDLNLHHPWDISTDQALEIAMQAEQAALDASNKITNSEGASVNTYEGHFILANSHGFVGGYPYSRHSVSVSPIASVGRDMQRDYWFSSARHAADLDSPQSIGSYAAQRALSRLSARRLKTGRYPVLFEAPLALGLLGAFVRATSGGALYRKASFLLDSLGTAVLSNHISITEDPLIPKAMGSSAFDGEGVKTQQREVVSDGVLQGYFLSSYTGRKLNMPTTGNAGGSHNLVLTSSLTEKTDDFAAMLRKMGTGLLVTELIGQGVNYVTGDYSRGAFGYWIENGEIAYPVEEITIAGNLADIYRQIVAVGSDSFTRGAKTSGSVLIEGMAVAGQ